MLEYPIKSRLIPSNKPTETTNMNEQPNKLKQLTVNSMKIKLLAKSQFRSIIYVIASILTLGIVPLIFYWFEDWRKHLYRLTTELDKADYILVESLLTKKDEIVPLMYDTCKLVPHMTVKRRYFFVFKEHFYYFGKSGLKMIRNEMAKRIKRDPQIIEYYKNGLAPDDRVEMHKVYSKNLIDIKKEPILWLALREILSPFTIFQIFSVTLWIVDDYALFAFVIFTMMVMAIATAVYENHTQGLRMRKMTYINEPVSVLKNEVLRSEKPMPQFARFIEESKNDSINVEMHEMQTKIEGIANRESISLAIGDIVHVKQGEKFTADILILEGKALANEAMLTGESVPVIKRSYERKGEFGDLNILFSGTECIMAAKVVGIVINTGFYTKKGEIIRTLLFNETEEFEFKKDAFKLLGIIFIICLAGFIWLIIYVKNSIYNNFYHNSLIIIRGLEMFTVAIPPMLPLSIAIGLEIASRRLKKKKIYTLFLDKINQAGRVKLCCFDKTGTLTENSLKLRGIQPIYLNTLVQAPSSVREDTNDHLANFTLFFDDMAEYEASNPMNQNNRNFLLHEGFACCQSLQNLDGKIIGDPLEVQLFNESGFTLSHMMPAESDEITLIRPSDSFIQKMGMDSNQIYVLEKTFDFTSDRKRMSVVVSTKNNRKMFLKGAPEIVKGLCLPNTLPLNFDEVLREFTEQGFRVLALAYKDFQTTESIDDVSENQLNFLGLVIFENPLKPESKDTLLTLKQCGIRSSIITGDNLLTALSVGISLHMFDYNLRVFIGDVENGNVVWEEIENESQRMIRGCSLIGKNMVSMKTNLDMSKLTSQNSFLDHNPHQKALFSSILKECQANNCVLCVTGEAFEMLFKTADIGKKTYQHLLNNTYIYARTSPSQKALIVSKYQEYYKKAFDEQWFVSFCGDGANDTEALKKADVGMSLTASEALLAATFNTTRDNVSCLIDLFIQAKCSLETSLQNAKYVVYYSLLQFIDTLFAYSKALEYANMHYFYWDLFVFLPLSIFIAQTEAVPSLNTHYPPTTLLNKKLIVSLFGQVLIGGFFMLIIYRISYRVCTNLEIYEIETMMPDDKDSSFYRETEALFFITAIMNAWGAIIFSKGYPFKKPVWTNSKVMMWVFLMTVITLFICYARYMFNNYSIKYFVGKVFRLLETDFDFVNCYVILTVMCVIFSMAYENFLVSKVFKLVKRAF